MSNTITPTCAVDGCASPAKARGWCMAHYKRWHRLGDPLASSRVVTSPQERFWAKVNKNAPPPTCRPGLGACWEWTAGKISTGYGAFHPRDGETVLAHRWSYTELRGGISDGLVVDHLCRNRACVNPDHLEPVSDEENLRRGAGYGLRNGMRNECIHGHTYTPENTYIDPTRGTIRCRECARIRDRARARKAA